MTSAHEKAFCVGADLKERNSFTDADLMAQRPVARAAYGGVLALPVPTIAAVDGFALGGGFEIALSCDLIVAAAGVVAAEHVQQQHLRVDARQARGLRITRSAVSAR